MQTTVDPAVSGVRQRAASEALAALGQTVGSLRCAGSQRLVRLGVSMTHFHVLTLLRHHDAMPIGRIAEILDASMSSATGIIDRMEERGLVERVRVPDDRRVVLVRPTPAGLELVDEAELVKSEVMSGAVARLSPDQLERLTAATTDLRLAIAAELDASPHHIAHVECARTHLAGSQGDGGAGARDLHAAPTSNPRTSETLAASPRVSQPAARTEPALKEG